MERGLVALVVTLGLLAFGVATDGLRAITSEGARRVAVEREPREIPQVDLRDHAGRGFSWSEFRGTPVLVEFIFTTCPTICQKMSSDFGALVRAEQENPESDTRFVSVSFDSEHDTTEQLDRVARHYGADGERWRFARIDDPAELAATLDAFGIVAIPSPVVGFEHNAAIHGLDSEGRLARIDDIAASEAMARWARGR